MADGLGGDDQICNTELGLGLYGHGLKRKHVFSLDLSLIPNDRGMVESNPVPKNGGGGEEEKGRGDDDRINSESCMRRKLRLSRDQTTMLEDSFKQQSTLTMAQKNILAERLNLKPRQVEVWFQNRRARTKLKKTEVDCKFWRKSYERLVEENRRLSKELFELRSTVKIEKPSVAAATPRCFILYPEGGRKI